MNGIWPHASQKNPCPICGKTDWCTFGDRAVLCQRIESNKPHPKGGWYHFYGDKGFRPLQPPRRSNPSTPRKLENADLLMRSFAQGTTSSMVDGYARTLGVSPESICQLGAAWAQKYMAWAYPMRDGAGKTVGIRLRSDSAKWAVTGSSQGVFVGEYDGSKVAFLPEGPTDSAALITLGLFPIGRPSCKAGGQIIAETLKRLGIYQAVIVADNDELKTFGTREERPGIEGAIKLKKEIGVKSVIWIPPSPIKDVREFVRKGGTRSLIEAEIKNKVWSKL